MIEATVEEIAGFVSANVKRKQVLDVLEKNGRKTYEELRKITRTPNVMLDKVIKDMLEYGAIVEKDGGYVLTENGDKAANIVFRQSGRGKAHKYDSNIQHEI